jgi:hypothetical protein
VNAIQALELAAVPKTKIFFSGSLFPLATLSNIEDHISFFASALFGLSWSLEAETCVYVEVLLFAEAIVALELVSGGPSIVECRFGALYRSYRSFNN